VGEAAEFYLLIASMTFGPMLAPPLFEMLSKSDSLFLTVVREILLPIEFFCFNLG
jgi:hypothetical protein